MKIKAVILATLAALAVTACNDEARDFSGSYKNGDKLAINIKKINNKKYEAVFVGYLDEQTKIAEVKDKNRLYDVNGSYLGEFTDEGLKSAGGTFYSKSN